VNIVLKEFHQAAGLWRYCLYRAYIHLKVRHRNSRLGLLWEPLFLLIVTSVLSLVWSKIFGLRDFESYFLYVLVGFAIWNFISSVVSRSVNLIRGYSRSIINSREPILSYVFSDIAYEVLVLLLKTPVILLCVLIFGSLNLTGLFISIYGVLLIVVSGVGFTLSFGFLAGFVGDIRELIATMMRLGFLITPVIWQIDRLGEYQNYVYLNPFYSYLTICRSPILGESVGPTELIIATSLTVIIFVSGIICMATKLAELKQKAFEV